MATHAAAAKSEGLDDQGTDRAVGQRLAPKTAHPSPLARCALRSQAPKVGAVCPNWARTVLCGGREVTRVPTAIQDPKRTSTSALHMSAHFGAVRQMPESNKRARCPTVGLPARSGQGCNHHNFNEHPGSPKVGREASPYRRVCRIDPLVPNRIVIFEQTHVSDPDLGA